MALRKKKREKTLSPDKIKILQEFLRHVVFDGWSDKAIKTSEKELKLSAGEIEILFPEGTKSLAEFYMETVNLEMEAAMSALPLMEMRIRDRIAAAVMARLKSEEKHKQAVRKLFAYLLMPKHSSLLFKQLYHIVDRIWRKAGDTSTDFNFYSKRLLLAGVLSSTFLYWLDDESTDHKETEAFLRRRIENVMKIQKTKGSIKEGLAKINALLFPFSARRG